MSEKRRRRVPKLIVRIKPRVKEDKKKAKVIEAFINYQLNKIRPEIWVNFVPRGTCSSCGQGIPSPKVKHREVFENIAWERAFLNKPPMKTTLEWEE